MAVKKQPIDDATRMHANITNSTTSKKFATSFHENSTSPVEVSSDILLSVRVIVDSILRGLEQDLHFKHRMKKTRMRGIVTLSSKLEMRRRANARTVVKVLQVVWIIRKTDINDMEFEFCGNDEETMVRKTANAKKTEMEKPAFSPQSVGNRKTQMFKIARVKIGKITDNIKYSGFRLIVMEKVIWLKARCSPSVQLELFISQPGLGS
ncbi:hypothetical protein DPMN_170042 [Dreissena polymorpha]|uniref:Uncharacterized protein n=1 Tax=Dreissena polymorpha TaxID=45954 RepID=A0A9D4DWC9_DREPO|nr:hypothetical protein DPMN_170042 [Dreissena polymorpha]